MTSGFYTCVLFLASVCVTIQSMAVAPHTYTGHIGAKASRSGFMNHINALPEQVDVHAYPYDTDPDNKPTVGDDLMEEFLTFLALKETGLLDLCLEMKR